MQLVLVYPEIPHNTGCAGRLSAALGLPLHLVEPLGYSLEDRYLKRAGLDYWPQVDLHVHPDLETMIAAVERTSTRPFAERVRPFSARGGRSLFEVEFQADDVLVFGQETKGLPHTFLDAYPGRAVYVPIRPGVRSLNLANVVCLGAYTALHSAGVPLPDNDGRHVPVAQDRAVQPADVARRSGGGA